MGRFMMVQRTSSPRARRAPRGRLSRLRAVVGSITAALGLATGLPATNPPSNDDLFAHLVRWDTLREIEPDWPDYSQGGGYAIYRLKGAPGSHRAEWSVVAASDIEIAERRMPDQAARWHFADTTGNPSTAPEGFFADMWRKEHPEGYTPPVETFRARARVPSFLWERRIPGRAKFVFLVLPSGEVGPLWVSASTHPALSVAIARALKEWKFQPATWQGHPVATLRSQEFSLGVRDEDEVTSDPAVGGIPAEPEDRDRLKQGAAQVQPRIRAISDIPYPAEAWPAERPETIEPLLVIDEDGHVAENDPDVQDPWREPTMAVIETWRFHGAKLDDRKVPWAIRIGVSLDDDRAMLRRAIEGKPNDVITDPSRHPPLLYERAVTLNLPGGTVDAQRRAVVDLLVDADGRVRATRLVETNDARFARLVRALAASSVYDRDSWRISRGAVWLRRTWTSE